MTVSEPVWMLTISRVARASSRVTEVRFWRTGVVMRRKMFSSRATTEATLREPLETMVWVGGWPGAVGLGLPGVCGSADAFVLRVLTPQGRPERVG